MNNNNNALLKKQLQKIFETILRIHDKLMNMPYSFKENKEQSKRILNAVGRLYEAFVALKGQKYD